MYDMKKKFFYRKGICLRDTGSDDSMVLECLLINCNDSPAGMKDFY